jgi:polyisoprenyl-teichoic acid--peptidoglycan teichoic acid transferase
MTRDPHQQNSGAQPGRRRRLRADEIRRARQARSAPISGRQVQSQQYQPRMSDQFVLVGQEPRRSGWTPLRLGLLAGTLSILMVAAIFVVPILIQMQRTADQVFVEPDRRVSIVENPDGSISAVVDEPDDSDDDDFEDISSEDDLPDWDNNERINIALFGVDSREEDEIARSDTIIIVSIDPEDKTVGMLSIPRDLEVQIPDVGLDKINSAYARGVAQPEFTGPSFARAVIEFNFDITIHYYAEVDFVGFINIVDTIGGVIIDNPALIKDDNYEWTRVYFATGPQHMDGATALRYVRTRYDDNDFARGMRQQQVLRALRQQGVRLNLITRVRDLLEDVGESFRTDLSIRQTLALARMANDIDGDNITSYSIIEATTEQWLPGEPYYLIPDWDEVHRIVNEMIPPDEDRSPDDDSDVPDHAASVLIQNATFVDRLAARHSEELINQGYTNIETGQADNAGDQPSSQLIVYGNHISTARDIASILGISSESIVQEEGSHPNGYSIVIVLGDDIAANQVGHR